MKKILAATLAFITITACVLLSACNNKFEPRISILAGTHEDYGFAVQRTSQIIPGSIYTTDDIITKANEVIAELEDKMEALRDYYTNIYEKNAPGICPINIPDVNAKIGTAGTLIVGTETDFGIFEFAVENPENIQGIAITNIGDIQGIIATSNIPYKNLTGLDIAIMILTADKLNMKIQVKEIFFDDLPAALMNNSIHVIAAAFSKTEARGKTMTFSNPYYPSTQTILSNKFPKLSALKSLKGKKIASQAGSTSEELILQAIESGQLVKGGKEKTMERVKTYGRVKNAYGDLKSGNIDAIVVDNSIAILLAAQEKNPKI